MGDELSLRERPEAGHLTGAAGVVESVTMYPVTFFLCGGPQVNAYQCQGKPAPLVTRRPARGRFRRWRRPPIAATCDPSSASREDCAALTPRSVTTTQGLVRAFSSFPPAWAARRGGLARASCRSDNRSLGGRSERPALGVGRKFPGHVPSLSPSRRNSGCPPTRAPSDQGDDEEQAKQGRNRACGVPDDRAEAWRRDT